MPPPCPPQSNPSHPDIPSSRGSGKANREINVFVSDFSPSLRPIPSRPCDLSCEPQQSCVEQRSILRSFSAGIVTNLKAGRAPPYLDGYGKVSSRNTINLDESGLVKARRTDRVRFFGARMPDTQ